MNSHSQVQSKDSKKASVTLGGRHAWDVVDIRSHVGVPRRIEYGVIRRIAFHACVQSHLRLVKSFYPLGDEFHDAQGLARRHRSRGVRPTGPGTKLSCHPQESRGASRRAGATVGAAAGGAGSAGLRPGMASLGGLSPLEPGATSPGPAAQAPDQVSAAIEADSQHIATRPDGFVFWGHATEDPLGGA